MEIQGLLLNVGVGVALREHIRVLLPEDVTHPAAGEDFQAAATLPHPEGDLCRQDRRARTDGFTPAFFTFLMLRNVWLRCSTFNPTGFSRMEALLMDRWVRDGGRKER